MRSERISNLHCLFPRRPYILKWVTKPYWELRYRFRAHLKCWSPHNSQEISACLLQGLAIIPYHLKRKNQSELWQNSRYRICSAATVGGRTMQLPQTRIRLHYRVFIKIFPKPAAPLHPVPTPRMVYTWNSQTDAAFAELNFRFCEPRFLAYSNFNKPFKVKPDASSLAIVAILWQKTRVRKNTQFNLIAERWTLGNRTLQLLRTKRWLWHSYRKNSALRTVCWNVFIS